MKDRVYRAFAPSCAWGTFVCIAFLFGIFVMSCGKVTQVAQSKKAAKSFELMYQLPVLTTGNFAASVNKDPNFPSRDVFTTYDTTIHAQVSGFKSDGNRDFLTWGRGILIPSKPVKKASSSSTNLSAQVKKPLFTSESYDKNGVLRPQSDLGWTHLSFDAGNFVWKGTSKKVKLGYSFYEVLVFSGPGKVALAIVAQQRVSGNSSVDLERVTQYDTFFAVLFKHWIQVEGKLPSWETVVALKALYDKTFFQTIGYHLPKNTTRRFKAKLPVFDYNRTLELALIEYYKLIRAEDFDAAETFIDGMTSPLLSKGSKTLLMNRLTQSRKKKKSTGETKT